MNCTKSNEIKFEFRSENHTYKNGEDWGRRFKFCSFVLLSENNPAKLKGMKDMQETLFFIFVCFFILFLFFIVVFFFSLLFLTNNKF